MQSSSFLSVEGSLSLQALDFDHQLATVDLHEYQSCLEQIPYGKRLADALYVYRGEDSRLGEALDVLLARTAVICGADGRHNVIKFRLDELKLSFLCYPDFLDNPHPALQH